MNASPPKAGRTHAAAAAACKWVLGGRIQAVGFRPFVYRLAQQYGLSGWVRNRSGAVEILAQGERSLLERFGQALVKKAPPLAQPRIFSQVEVEPEPAENFEIRESKAAPGEQVHLPPDYFACDECLAELLDPRDRRYRYPFINCTQCGPRYTLIARLPYDRFNTTMAQFDMCPQCTAEYANPRDRRFHAEPIACPQCGPRLEYRAGADDRRFAAAALAAGLAALRAGKILAVKGIGGYHLLCDAASSKAVAMLRQRKRRPDKPLAVMVPFEAEPTTLCGLAHVDGAHLAILRDPMRPIVLVPKRPDCGLAPEIAPGCADIGVLLPYSPLHHLLLTDFKAPLVATSGNIAGEPVLTDAAMAERRLAPIADAFLHHDRPILRPADDPVYRIIAGKPRPMRLGRGNAPLELELPMTLRRPLLALGGHMKDTVALAWDNRVVVSPHLGDMDTVRACDLLEEIAANLQSLYGVSAQAVVCDAHPGYATAKLAAKLGLPIQRIFHHEAHASALAGESAFQRDLVVFAWDGAGYGRDGTIWGGEALVGRPGRWLRAATLRSFALIGGDRAAREPWRCAAALCWEAGRDWDACPEDTSLLRHAWMRAINCPRTSSVGRLFDAASALVGLQARTTYEAQGAMGLEAVCNNPGEPIALPLKRRHDGVWESDWSPLIPLLANQSKSLSDRSACFHESLAELLLAQARTIRAEYGISDLGLSGGVFQNRVLCERVMAAAEREGFSVKMLERLPCNDAGLSFGQIIEAAASA